MLNPPPAIAISAMKTPAAPADPSSSSFEGWRSCCDGADFGPALAAGDFQHLETGGFGMFWMVLCRKIGVTEGFDGAFFVNVNLMLIDFSEI
jgi:hypothetical protein